MAYNKNYWLALSLFLVVSDRTYISFICLTSSKRFYHPFKKCLNNSKQKLRQLTSDMMQMFLQTTIWHELIHQHFMIVT